MLLAQKLMGALALPPGGWSVVYNGTSAASALAGDFVIAIQTVTFTGTGGGSGTLPALAAGFTSLATDIYAAVGGAEDNTAEVGLRASCAIVAGPPTIANLTRCLILRPSVAAAHAAVATTLDANALTSPVGLVYWGIRATAGTPAIPGYPTVGALTRSSEWADNGSVSFAAQTAGYGRVLAAYVGDGNLRPGSYALAVGTNTDFSGFRALYGA